MLSGYRPGEGNPVDFAGVPWETGVRAGCVHTENAAAGEPATASEV